MQKLGNKNFSPDAFDAACVRLLISFTKSVATPDEKIEEAPELFSIVFVHSSKVDLKSKNESASISFIDINSEDFHVKELSETGLLESFDLKFIFPWSMLNHAFRVLIQGDVENIDYYISVQEHAKIIEEGQS